MARPRTVLAVCILLTTSLAGCMGDAEAPGTPDDAPSSTLSAEPTATRTLAIAEEGTLPAGAHVEGRTAPVGQWDRWFELEIDGVVTRGQITMTWEATNPSMESLLVGFGPRKGSGDGAHARPTAVTATGTSPLTLTVDGIQWQTHDYVVWAWWDPETEPQGSPVDQALTIEGTVDVRAR